jgi:hypothetical protein
MRAARLFAAAARYRTEIGMVYSPGESLPRDRELAAARQLVDEAAWEAAWNEGQAMTLDQAIDYALEEGDDPVLSGDPLGSG